MEGQVGRIAGDRSRGGEGIIKKMPSRHAVRRLPLLVFLCACFLVCSAGFAQNGQKEFKARFHQDFRGGDPKNPNLRPVRDANFRWEAEGARITIVAGEGRVPTTGIAGNFRIKGDFEITASYEVLAAEKPTEGYGVGISLFVAIDPEALDAVSLARRIGVKGNVLFLSDRMKPSGGNPVHTVRTKQSKAPAGKLRIQRLGSMVRFFVAEGDDPEFVPIYQDGNAKKIDAEFGDADIRYFQVGGDAGNSQSALDLRLLDLTVSAEELSGLADVAAKRVVPPWILNPPAANAEPSAWPSWLVAIVIVCAALLPIGVVAWRVLGRRTPRTAKAGVPRTATDRRLATLSFVCASCGKKLKAKVTAAGRKIKCARCGKIGVVPPADAIEADETSS
jgi:DNA-directed RNA polymerase subunit RPC12/RpoP